jgi:hypothetical protein
VNTKFTPRSLADLVAWWDASEPTTLFQDTACTIPAAADGDVVGGWKDRFAGIIASQATAAKKPLLKLGIQNGRPVVRPDAVDDGFSVAISKPVGSFTFYYAGNARTGVDIWLFDTETGRMVIGNATDADKIAYYDDAWHDIAATTAGWQALTWILASGGNGLIFRNGVYLGYGTYTAKAIGGAVGFLIDKSFTARMWGADVGEFLIYSRAHTLSEVAKMNAYLKAKWGI